jgi:hypothetical protein
VAWIIDGGYIDDLDTRLPRELLLRAVRLLFLPLSRLAGLLQQHLDQHLTNDQPAIENPTRSTGLVRAGESRERRPCPPRTGALAILSAADIERMARSAGCVSEPSWLAAVYTRALRFVLRHDRDPSDAGRAERTLHCAAIPAKDGARLAHEEVLASAIDHAAPGIARC